MPDPHAFIVRFRIPGATEPDEYAVRGYDAPRLQDMALMGPDESGVFMADFERDDASFPAAVLSALGDLAAVYPEAQLLRLEQDNLVSLAAIARKLGRSHESVRLYARGKRGLGGFPAPTCRLDAKTEVWRWPDVALWWHDALGEEVPQLEDDRFLTMLNDALELRQISAELDLPADHLDAIAELLPPQLRKRESRGSQTLA